MTLVSVEGWAKAHWDELLKSNTVRALITLEAGSIAAFINGVISGTQGLDINSLKMWLLLQAGIIIAFFMRHAMAGIELRLKGFIPPDTITMIESNFISRIEKKNPVLAKLVNDHVNDEA